MKSLEVLKKLTPLGRPYDKAQIKRMLAEGTTIFCGDYTEDYQFGLKYATMKIDNILYSFNMTNTTEEQLGYNLEQAAIFNDNYFDVLWDGYLSERDFLIPDIDGIVDDVDPNFYVYSHKQIREYFSQPENKMSIAAFQTP